MCNLSILNSHLRDIKLFCNEDSASLIKMGFLRDHGKHCVPFEFEGNVVHLRITRYTKFNDVVHKLLTQVGMPPSSSKMYAVFECTSRLQRKIAGDVRVLKIWQSWGSEIDNFRFVVMYRDTTISLRRFNENAADEVEKSIDSLFIESYKLADKDESSVVGERSFESGNIPSDILNKHPALANIAFHLDKTKRDEEKQVKKMSSRKHHLNNESYGKRALLAKYFNDLGFFNKRKNKVRIPKLGDRETADGSELTSLYGDRHVEGMDISVDRSTTNPFESTTISLANCRYHWQKHHDSDTDSDISEDCIDSELDTDEESGVSFENVCGVQKSVLDTAFVKSSRESDSDEGIDVKSINSNDLDTAFVCEVGRKYVTDTDLSRDSSDMRELCEFDRNISTSDFVRKMFGSDDLESVGSQDDEIDSFMRTRLDSF